MQKKCHSRVKTTWTCEALDDFLLKGQLSDYNYNIHRFINVQVAILFLITDMKLDFERESINNQTGILNIVISESQDTLVIRNKRKLLRSILISTVNRLLFACYKFT